MAGTPLTDAIEALTTYSNTVTGASDTTLSEAVATLASGYGGGGTDDFPLHDGDTHLWMDIDQDYIDYWNGSVTIYFNQSVTDGITFKWGDGSATQTVSGTGDKTITHTYTAVGKYRIDIAVAVGCVAKFQRNSNGIFGRAIAANQQVYATMYRCKYIEIGARVDAFLNGAYEAIMGVDCTKATALTACPSFQNNYNLRTLILPPNITTGNDYNLQGLRSLIEITIPSTVTQIPSRLGDQAYSLMRVFMKPTTPPTLSTGYFNTKQGFKIIVPYSEDHSVLTNYQTANNWSNYASYMEEAPNE